MSRTDKVDHDTRPDVAAESAVDPSPAGPRGTATEEPAEPPPSTGQDRADAGSVEPAGRAGEDDAEPADTDDRAEPSESVDAPVSGDEPGEGEPAAGLPNDDPPHENAGPAGRAGRRRALVRNGAVVLLVLAALATAAWAITVAWRSHLPDGVALRVNDREVTVADLDDRTRALEAIYGARAPQDEAGREAYQRDVAKSVAVGIVLADAGAEAGVGVSEQQARALLDGFVRQNFPQGRDAFVGALGEAGTSEPAVLREVELQATTGQLFERLTAGAPPVTDADVRQAYDTGRHELVVPEQRRIRNVVLPGRAEADAAIAQLRAGADFGALVPRTLDASTRDSGGDLGVLPAAAFEKPYADAAFAAPRGAPFGPVQTSSGWNVGLVSEVVPGRPLSFDEVRDRLREKVTTERELAVWRGWVAERIRVADITYADEYRPADPAALPEAPGVTAPGTSPATGGTVPEPTGGLGTTTIVLSVVQLVLASGLFLLGRWGWRGADRLVPAALPESERASRTATYRRGAVACQVLAGLLVVVVAVTVAVALI